MLSFDCFPVGPLACNCVLVWDSAKGTGVVVDPGGEASKILARVEARGFKVEALLHTHAHFDHVGATKELQDLWQCPAYLHPDDDYLIEALDQQTGFFGMPRVPRPEMQPMQAGGCFHGLTVRHTPGHSLGSCCFLGDFEQGPVVLAGDTLFQGGVGRTDVMGGRQDQLVESIRRELYSLADTTRVLTGHGPATTIGDEARWNPFVRR
jgi:hydroxyacylglutathione hydrolase